MKVYSTEEEQIQALQNWFKRHGVKILTTIAVVSASLFGWNYWQSSKEQYKASASALYEKLQASKDDTEQNYYAKQLSEDYSKTIYGKIGSIFLTNQKAAKQNWQEAADDYKTIYNDLKSWPDLQVVVLENWVRSKLELKQADDAYTDLVKIEEENNLSKLYPINFYNLKGDVLFQQDKNQEAVEAYNKAIDFSNAEPELQQQTAQFVNWIVLKRNDLLEAKPLK